MKRTSKTAPTTEQEAEALIEKQGWLVGDINRYRFGGLVALHNRDYCELVGFQFVSFFTRHQNGTTPKYTWETRKVDKLINLRVWKTAR